MRDLAALARHVRAGGLAWIGDVVSSAGDIGDLSEEGHARLASLCSQYDHLRRAADTQPVGGLIDTIARDTGLWQSAGPQGGENLLRLIDLASRFAPVEAEPDLKAFVEYAQLLVDAEEDLAEAHSSGTDSAQVMTIHQAKGLEFPHVYVPGLAGTRGNSRIFPDNRSGENALTNAAALPWWLREDEGIPSPALASSQAEIDTFIRKRRLDEEWRLLYVACTRAKSRLTCSAAHWYRDATEPQGPSQFYEFICAQADVVNERFAHEPAAVAPHVAARQRQRIAR